MSSEERPFYKPELDALRFTAFALVFVHHFFPERLAQSSVLAARFQAGCELGVQIFFLLSSFLITDLLLKEREKTSTIDVRAFYIRRILRIWPLYFLLTISAAILTLVWPSVSFPLKALAYFALLSGNWYVVLYGWVQSLISPLWTISIEEQFYLIWPATLRAFAPKGLAVLAGAFAILSYVALYLLGSHHAAENHVRANSFVQFQFFSLGAGLALLLHKRSFQPGFIIRFVLVAISVMATGAAVSYGRVLGPDGVSSTQLVTGYLLLAVATATFFLAFLNAKIPSWAGPTIYLGRISYGLYAFHFIAFGVTAYFTQHILPTGTSKLISSCIHIIFAALLTFALAFLSYNFIEKPFLRMKSRFTLVKSRDDLTTAT